MKKFIVACLFSIENFLPNSVLNMILMVTLRAQGRGWNNAIENEVEHIAHTISKKNITRIMAVDAGANKGDWSLELIKHYPQAQVYAFEPSAFTFILLKTNLETYTNVIIVNSG